jgi:NarL family two-component system sensor histidine kinase YdfH
MSQPIAIPSTEDDHYPLPIFLFLTGLLVWVIVGSLLTQPRLQALLPASAIIGLMVVHLLLHWHSPRLANRERPWMQIALAQGGLGIALTFTTGNPSVWAAAFTWLIGEAVGLLDKPRLSAVSLALYGALGVAALFAITDAATAIEWLGATLPSALFVGLVVVLYKRQVEAREQAQQLVAELEGANRQISAYAERVEELTLTNERQRMARELHDTLSQDVAGLVLQLEAASAHLDAGRTEKAQAIVRQAMSRARSTLRDARAAIDDLRADDARARLSERLDALCRRFRAETEAACDLTIELGHWDAALSTAHKEQLERIVSEALANIRKHAQATRVTIRVQAQAETLILRVEDNGVGFEAKEELQQGHYGLRGLQERARLLGGTLHVASEPGAGTAITLEMPLVSDSVAAPADA